MKVIGIIPARGGSKGILNKNLAPCNGKPLIYWTIREAKRSSLDGLYVSTDCPRIADYAGEHGVEVLWRPANLATDTARTVDALRWHLEHNLRAKQPDAVFTLQPTNPLRTASVIDNACCLLEDGDGEEHPTSIISFTDVGERHPARMYRTEGNCMLPHEGGAEWMPRQALPKRYVRTGEVYATKTDTLLAGSMAGERCLPYFLGKDEAWNVDDATDLVIVEALMKARGA